MKNCLDIKILNNVLFLLIIILLFIIFCMSCIHFHTQKIEHKTQINNLEWEKADAEVDLRFMKRMVNYLKDDIHHSRVRKVKITFYSPSLGGINSDSDPSKTATMTTPIIGLTCAISRNLVEDGWLGSTIYIQGIGIRQATDIMGKEYKGKKIFNQIDILTGPNDVKKEAKKLGNNINILASLL